MTEALTKNNTERLRKLVGAVLGPLCALVLWFMPIDGLAEQAHHLLALMSMVAIWWITEPVPIPVTSLLGPTLCVAFGIVNVEEAYAKFAASSSPSVWRVSSVPDGLATPLLQQ